MPFLPACFLLLFVAFCCFHRLLFSPKTPRNCKVLLRGWSLRVYYGIPHCPGLGLSCFAGGGRSVVQRLPGHLFCSVAQSVFIRMLPRPNRPGNESCTARRTPTVGSPTRTSGRGTLGSFPDIAVANLPTRTTANGCTARRLSGGTLAAFPTGNHRPGNRGGPAPRLFGASLAGFVGQSWRVPRLGILRVSLRIAPQRVRLLPCGAILRTVSRRLAIGTRSQCEPPLPRMPW